MQFNKLVYLLVPTLFLGGCVGLSHKGFAERKALADSHSAKSKVIRKKVKLHLATIAAVSAEKSRQQAHKELEKAKEDHARSRQDLKDTLKL